MKPSELKRLEREILEDLDSLDEQFPNLIEQIYELQRLGGVLDDWHKDILLFVESHGRDGLNYFLQFVPKEARPVLRHRFYQKLLESSAENN